MVIAGTGHRPRRLGGYDPKIQERLKNLAVNEFEKYQVLLKENEPLIVISGMALGWDTRFSYGSFRIKY